MDCHASKELSPFSGLRVFGVSLNFNPVLGVGGPTYFPFPKWCNFQLVISIGRFKQIGTDSTRLVRWFSQQLSSPPGLGASQNAVHLACAVTIHMDSKLGTPFYPKVGWHSKPGFPSNTNQGSLILRDTSLGSWLRRRTRCACSETCWPSSRSS